MVVFSRGRKLINLEVVGLFFSLSRMLLTGRELLINVSGWGFSCSWFVCNFPWHEKASHKFFCMEGPRRHTFEIPCIYCFAGIEHAAR